MYIGEVSKLTGATPRAIRLYENMGLIPIPNRTGKYRDYKDNAVELIKIIKAAQSLGFKLSEIKELSSGDISCEEFPWEKAATLVQEKILSIRNEITSFNQLITDLNEFLAMLENKKCNP